MGIHDRQYYRDERGHLGLSTGWSITLWLILVNVAIFLLMAMLPAFAKFAYEHGYFSTYHVLWHRDPVSGKPGGLEFWRFLTFQFLHGGTMHLVMNMLGLFVFGQVVEEHMGRKKYLAFYLVCGIAGGLMYLILNLGGFLAQMWNLPRLFFLVDRVDTPLVGASAGVFGIIMACAYIAPNMEVMIFGVLPMRVKLLAYAYVGIALLTVFLNGTNAGGEAAHLGGAIAGAFFIRNSHHLRDFFDVFKDSRKVPRTPPRPVRSRMAPPSRSQLSHDAEVDRILAKVKEKGTQSLTEGEKRTLARDTDEKRARG